MAAAVAALKPGQAAILMVDTGPSIRSIRYCCPPPATMMFANNMSEMAMEGMPDIIKALAAAGAGIGITKIPSDKPTKKPTTRKGK